MKLSYNHFEGKNPSVSSQMKMNETASRLERSISPLPSEKPDDSEDKKKSLSIQVHDTVFSLPGFVAKPLKTTKVTT